MPSEVSAANRPRLPWVKRIYAETGAVCPNGPDEGGNWPCERGAHDECVTCGWAVAATDPRYEGFLIASEAPQPWRWMIQEYGVRAWLWHFCYLWRWRGE